MIEGTFNRSVFTMRFLVFCCLIVLSLTAVADTSPHWSDAQLRQFSQAEQAVQQVKLHYVSLIANAEKTGENNKWNKAAMQMDMGKAVKAAGLTRKEYNQIAHAMANSQTLRERIDKLSANQ